MRVLIIKAGVAHREREGQYNSQELGICNSLVKLGHSVHILYFSNTVERPEVSDYNKEITYIPCLQLSNQSIVKTKYLDRFSADAVFIMADNKLFLNLIIEYYKKRNITVVCYFGVLFTNSRSHMKRLVSRLILEMNRKAFQNTTNIAKTETAKNELNRYGLTVSDVIPVGLDESKLHKEIVDRDVLRRNMGIGLNDKVVLFVGRFVKEKMAPFFVEIMQSIMSAEDQTYKAIIIGKGQEEDLVNSAINGVNRDNFIIVSSVPYDEMYKYYCVADCFVNLSKIEIFGMAVLESMYYKCPVVAHNAPGPDSIIESGISGTLINNYDKKEWCKEIVNIINKKTIIEAAYDRVNDKFMWDQIALKIEKYLGGD